MDLLALGEGIASSVEIFNCTKIHFRICPGRHLAHASLWIAIASVLATLNISKAVDDDGKEITPEAAFVSGLTRFFRLFSVS